MSLNVRSKFWLVDESGKPVFGGGKEVLLKKIDELGSISAAAKDLKMSYRAAWGKIRTTEARIGMNLVETSVGGGPGRGARLTPAAKKLLETFEELHDQGNLQADKLFKKLFKLD